MNKKVEYTNKVNPDQPSSENNSNNIPLSSEKNTTELLSERLDTTSSQPDSAKASMVDLEEANILTKPIVVSQKKFKK